MHDERGTASIKWHDAPDDEERLRLELESGDGRGREDSKLRRGFELSIEKPVDTFNPYDRKPDVTGTHKSAAGTGKRDLRKLSEWIKQMKALEERKKNGEPSDDD